jgi:hypothetical protein
MLTAFKVTKIKTSPSTIPSGKMAESIRYQNCNQVLNKVRITFTNIFIIFPSILETKDYSRKLASLTGGIFMMRR